jgi:hypothetical protein
MHVVVTDETTITLILLSKIGGQTWKVFAFHHQQGVLLVNLENIHILHDALLLASLLPYTLQWQYPIPAPKHIILVDHPTVLSASEKERTGGSRQDVRGRNLHASSDGSCKLQNACKK